MTKDTARPNLNTDRDYLKNVEDLIEKGKYFGHIKFELLDVLVHHFLPDVHIYDLSKREDAKEQIEKIAEDIFKKINNEETGEKVEMMLRNLWDYLSEADEIKNCDLIFVFGGISRLAVEHAINLKNAGYAPKIMFSGKHASYVDGIEKTEAESYRDMAIEKGVSNNDILIENNSINTPENISKSAEILKKYEVAPSKIIAVSLPYHMRRAHLTMWAGFDWCPEIIRSPGPSAKYTRDTYWKDFKGFSYVFFEYLKIFGAREMGHF